VTPIVPMWTDPDDVAAQPELIEDGWVRGRGILVKNYLDGSSGDEVPSVLVVATDIQRDYEVKPVESLADVPFNIIRDDPSRTGEPGYRNLLARLFPRPLFRLVEWASRFAGAEHADARRKAGLEPRSFDDPAVYPKLLDAPAAFRAEYFGGLGVLALTPQVSGPENTPPNDAGVQEYLHGWILTDSQRLVWFVAPAGLADRAWAPRDRILWEGYFYKWRSYPSRDGQDRLAPVFVLTRLEVVPAREGGRRAAEGEGESAAGAGLGALAGMGGKDEEEAAGSGEDALPLQVKAEEENDGAQAGPDAGVDPEAAEPDEPEDPAWRRGKELFQDTQDRFYPSCASCHRLVPAGEEADAPGHLGPGPTLFGSALRAGWRNRTNYANVAEASVPCAKSWQERKRGLTDGQKSDLLVFLKHYVPEGVATLPARKVERKPPLLEDLAGGDAERGAQIVARYCAGCHQPGEDALSFELEPGRKRADLIARKVRGYDAHGRFKPDGSMSYFTTGRLSDDRLRDVIAHLGR